jgi:hypothetical protein
LAAGSREDSDSTSIGVAGFVERLAKPFEASRLNLLQVVEERMP